jgi:hypothetical protein
VAQRSFKALDELDELPIKPLQPLYHFCSRTGCRRRRRQSGRYCLLHHNEVTERWRDSNRRLINLRRRNAGSSGLEEQQKGAQFERARATARAKLYVAIARGKVVKEPCQECGLSDVPFQRATRTTKGVGNATGRARAQVTAYMPDINSPLSVMWLCRECRRDGIDRIERLRTLEEGRVQEERRRRRAEEALTSFLPEVRSALEAETLDALPPLLRRAGTPLYQQMLVRTVEAYLAASDPSRTVR